MPSIMDEESFGDRHIALDSNLNIRSVYSCVLGRVIDSLHIQSICVTKTTLSVLLKG